jgi:hypothetical protein
MTIHPEPAQVLRALLTALGPNSRDPLLVTRSEAAHWPQSLFNALLETALIHPAGSANIVVCPGCHHACAMNVNSDTLKPATRACSSYATAATTWASSGLTLATSSSGNSLGVSLPIS